MKRLLNYPGSKWSMAEEIVKLMPKHKAYLEPFFGSGAVFFSKPKDIVETINDIDGRLVNLFRVMRDNPERLQYLVEHTLYSREEYLMSIEACIDPVEDARRMLVRLWFAVGGKTSAVSGFRKNISWKGPYNTYEWTDMYGRIGHAAIRLKDAQIENKPALELIEQHNDSDTLIYCDPPYLKSELVSSHYKYDFSFDDHKRLLELIKAHTGPAMISGYDSELYDEHLKGWNRFTKTTKVGITNKRKSDREEILWCNFPIQQSMKQLELI